MGLGLSFKACTVLATVICIWLLAAAGAQAQWLSPVNISESGENAGVPRVVLDAAGDATAVWDRWNGSDTVVETAYRPAGGNWSAPVQLSEAPNEGSSEGAVDSATPSIAVDANGDVSVAWERYAGTEILVQADYRPAGGGWQAPVDIGSGPLGPHCEPWIAVDHAGDATVVWKDGETLESAYRPAAGSWQSPVLVATEAVGTLRAAVDTRGDATATWMHYDGSKYVTETSYRPAGGSWETPTSLSESGEEGGDPQIALDAAGDTLVVWDGHTMPFPDMVRAAYRPSGGSWQSAEDLSAPGEDIQELRVGLDGDGDALVAWSGSSKEVGGYTLVRTAYKPAGGAWGEPETISAAGQNAFPSDLAFDAAGNAALVWQRYNGSNNIMQASYRPAGGGWEAAANISESGKNADDAAVVLGAPGDARAAAEGDATIVYTSSEGEGCDVAEGPRCTKHPIVTVQAAGYDVHDSPVGDVEVPETGTAGTPVEVTLPTEDVFSPVLEFGDGASSSSDGKTLHTYSEPGTYTVTFSGTEVLGYRSTVHRTIVIEPASSTSSPPPGGHQNAGEEMSSSSGVRYHELPQTGPVAGSSGATAQTGSSGGSAGVDLSVTWPRQSRALILARRSLSAVCHMSSPGVCTLRGAAGHGQVRFDRGGSKRVTIKLTAAALAKLRRRHGARLAFELSDVVSGRPGLSRRIVFASS